MKKTFELFQKMHWVTNLVLVAGSALGMYYAQGSGLFLGFLGFYTSFTMRFAARLV